MPKENKKQTIYPYTVKYYYRACLALFLLTACKQAPTRSSVFNTANLPSQLLEINTRHDTTLLLDGGTVITIPAGALETADGGPARLEVKAALTIDAMIKAGLHTQSDGKPLQSAGMIYINAAEGAAVKIRKPIQVAIPGNDIAADMMLFKGEVGSDGINWIDPQPLTTARAVPLKDQGEVLFNQLCASCHHPTQKITGPVLYGAMQRWQHDTANVYAFTRNSAALLDWHPYACCLFNTYNKQAMPAFEELTDEELTSIYNFIDREGKKQWGTVPQELAGSECDSCMHYRGPQRKLRPVYYDVYISAFGWYNIDAFLKEFGDRKRSRITVTIAGNESRPVAVYLVVPYYKVLEQGTLLKDEKSYGFFDDQGGIPLPKKIRAYIIAIAEGADTAVLYYGQTSFLINGNNAFTVQLAPSSKEKLYQQITALGVAAPAVVMNTLARPEPVRNRCDCGTGDVYPNHQSEAVPGVAGDYIDVADHEEEEEQTSTTRLNLFNNIPEQIDGCSGLYTYDSIPLQQQRYLFASNLQELAFVKINSRQITLNLLKREKLSKEVYRNTYEGGGYKVILQIKAVKRSGDELFYNTGTLEIWQGEKNLRVKIHGESGC